MMVRQMLSLKMIHPGAQVEHAHYNKSEKIKKLLTFSSFILL
jgi:hypothetical protein